MAPNDNNRCLKVLFLNSFYDSVFSVCQLHTFSDSVLLAENLELDFDTGGEPRMPVMTSGRDSEGQLYPACFAPSISAVLINIKRL